MRKLTIEGVELDIIVEKHLLNLKEKMSIKLRTGKITEDHYFEYLKIMPHNDDIGDFITFLYTNGFCICEDLK